MAFWPMTYMTQLLTDHSGVLTLSEDTTGCTRCGSKVHSKMKIDDHDVFHVICYGCSFEWVE